jgi:hypothetical protein
MYFLSYIPMNSPRISAIPIISTIFAVACAHSKESQPIEWDKLFHLGEDADSSGVDGSSLFNLRKKVDISGVEDGKGQYTHYLPINFIAINANWRYRFGEKEVEVSVEALRKSFDQCGIKIVVKKAELWDGPEEFNTLDKDPNDRWKISPEEQALLSAFHKRNEITIYIVRRIRSGQFNRHSHAMATSGVPQGYGNSFIGTVYILREELPNGMFHYGKYVPPHEVAHVLFDEADRKTGPPNILNTRYGGESFNVNSEQCRKAKASSFVYKIKPPKNKKNNPNPKAQRRMKIPRKVAR